MTIAGKNVGAYKGIVSISRKGGVYAAVHGAFVKVAGAYQSVSAGASSDAGVWAGVKGTNVAMPFMYGMAADASNLYGTAVYSPTWEASTKPLLAKIKSAGHDHVRFNFQPGPFLEAIKNGNTTRLNQLFTFLKTAIDDTLAAGLNVFLTPHTNPENPLWTPSLILGNMAGAEYGYYKALLVECANRFKSYSTARLSYSIFNEPPDDITSAQWQVRADDLYDAVRAVMPKHTLIITGADNGSMAGMLALNMAHFDANTRATFHFYEPQEFTFQAQTFTAWKYITTGLPWPVPATSLASHLTTANANVDADGALTTQQKTDKKAINDFFINVNYAWFARVKIMARFADAARWAAAQGINPNRIYMGEFGCSDAINITHQAEWFKDVRLAAEAYGMQWCTFLYDAANYKVSDASGNLKAGLVSPLFGVTTPQAETNAILAAMAPAPDVATAAAIDRVVSHLKDTGIWATGGSMLVPVAHSQQAALLDWMLPSRAGVTTGTLDYVTNKYVAGNGSSFRDTKYRMGAAGSKFRSGDATMAYLKLGGPDGDGDIGNLNGNNALSRQTGYGATGINTYTLNYPGLGTMVAAENRGNRGFLGAVSRVAGSYEVYDLQYNSIGVTNAADAEDQADFTLWQNANGYSTARIGAAWVGSKLTADQIRVLGINMQDYALFKNALWS